MMKITTIGLDLAKHVFHVVCCDEQGKVIRKNMLKRSQVLANFATLPSCLVGMEACASAHHWARELGVLGHQVKLIPVQSKYSCGSPMVIFQKPTQSFLTTD